jgi:hypothetical protein
MKRLCTFVLALGAAGFSTSGAAAKPGKCSPQLLAPSGLAVTSDGTTVTSEWNEVNDLAKEATKYSVEVTAHYDAHGDVKFGFTAFDDDPGELDTASLGIAASSLDTTVCADPPDCTSTTTHSATSVTVQVKGLIPPSKGKDQSQCNPFSGPVTASLASASCPCFDAGLLVALAGLGSGTFVSCQAALFTAAGTLWSAIVDPGTFSDYATADAQTDPVRFLNCRVIVEGSVYAAVSDLSEAEFEACTSLIEAAQVELGCNACAGPNCPP